MSDCLVILNVRDIAATRRAFDELPIAKLWLTGYTERELAKSVFEWAIAEADFDRFFVCADDIIVRPHVLQAVQRALDGGCEVATGYSQRSHTDLTVNVTSGPLRDSRPTVEAYEFRQLHEVLGWPEPLVPTWFAGFSVTGMSKDLWQRFGFGCFTDGPDDKGYASDFHLSRQLQDARVPIHAVREAFAYHWRHEWRHTNDPDDEPLFLGEREPSVTLQPAANQADVSGFESPRFQVVEVAT